jgi:PKD repeat protein
MKSYVVRRSSNHRVVCAVLSLIVVLTFMTPDRTDAQDSGNALQFNGTSNYVNFGIKDTLKPAAELTIEAWFNAEKQQWRAAILSNAFQTQLIQSGYGLTLDGSSGVYFGLTTLSGGMLWLQAANCVTLNRWHHIAGTYDGATMRLYVDGVLKGSLSKAGNLDYDPPNPLTIARYRDDDEEYWFKGKIDEVRVWHVARTGAQIQTNLARPLNGNEAGLVGYWRLDEGSGTTAHDATSLQNDGTIVGATWTSSGAFIASGTLTGKVTNALTGNVLSGATLAIAGLSATSGSDGAFSIGQVPVGSLKADFSATPRNGVAPLMVQFTDQSIEGAQTVTVSASGYSSYVNDRVVISGGGTTNVNVSLSPALAGSALRLVLNWGAKPLDLNAHLRTPTIGGTSYHVYFGDKGSSVAPPYAKLDHDEMNGGGPETVTLSQLSGGTYKYYVHRFSSDGSLIESGAVVQVYGAGGLVKTFQMPRVGTGDYWYVCDIDGTTGVITTVNSIQSTEALAVEDVPESRSRNTFTLRRYDEKAVAQGVAAYTYNWSFGDGTTSTVQNPVKTYPAPGSYTVRLVVTSASRVDTMTRTDYIAVGATGVRYASSVLGFSTQYGAGARSAAQAVGPPNVYPLYGDMSEAWASSTPDGQREYLELGFSYAGPVSSIAIYETYSPGAVDTIYVKNPNTNQWEKVWSGTATAQPPKARVFVVNFPITQYNVSQVRLAINSPAVAGWNEIDAVAVSNQPMTHVSDSELQSANALHEFALLPSYPNPFNPSTRIQFSVAERGRTVVKVIGVLGQEIVTLMDDVAEPGRWYVRNFDASGLPSGIYFATVETGGTRLVQKMVLMK